MKREEDFDVVAGKAEVFEVNGGLMGMVQKRADELENLGVPSTIAKLREWQSAQQGSPYICLVCERPHAEIPEKGRCSGCKRLGVISRVDYCEWLLSTAKQIAKREHPQPAEAWTALTEHFGISEG